MSESPRKRPVQREWAAQEIDWAFLMKALPYGALARGIDQAAKRSAAANKARLLRGCLPGTPDTYILYKGITLWLERKAEESLTTDQKLFRDQVLANGGHWAEVRSTEDVEWACRQAGIPLRATLGEIRSRIAEQNDRLGTKKRASRPRKTPPRYTFGKRATARAHAKRLL